MDKGKIIQLLKGYATDSKDKKETSIDYCRIDNLAEDLYLLFAREARENLQVIKDLEITTELKEDYLTPNVARYFENSELELSISNIQRHFKLGYFRASRIFIQISYA